MLRLADVEHVEDNDSDLEAKTFLRLRYNYESLPMASVGPICR